MAEEISTVDEEDDSSESGDESDWATEESKLVLVVRTELGMTKGIKGSAPLDGRTSLTFMSEQARLQPSADTQP